MMQTLNGSIQCFIYHLKLVFVFISSSKRLPPNLADFSQLIDETNGHAAEMFALFVVLFPYLEA